MKTLKTENSFNPEDYCTVSEAAEICDVDERTIYNWLKSGKLSRFKLNWQRLIVKAEAEKYATPQPEEAA